MLCTVGSGSPFERPFQGVFIVTQIVLDLPHALVRRIERLAAIEEMTQGDILLLALEAACTPDYRKLQEMYAICERADTSHEADVGDHSAT